METRRKFLRHAALASAAPALLRAADRPNVLWLMTDEQRPDSLGCYGRPWASTPHADKLAAEGVLYENAYTPAPVCVPARSCLLTGNYGSTLDVLHNQQRIGSDTRLLTWLFEDHGYKSASFGKKHYFCEGRQAFQTEGGRPTEKIVEPQEYAKRFNMADYDVVRYPDAPTEGLRRRWILAGEFPEAQRDTAEAKNIDLALQWFGRHDVARPFFLRLSLNAPHTPVVTPRKYLDAINPDSIDLPIPRSADLTGKPRHETEHLQEFEGALCLTPDQIRKHRHYYYARAAFADAEFGRLLDWMRPLGLLDNTIVVFNSDHGTHVGDQELVQKQTFYEQVATVPYIFWWNGIAKRGARLHTPVNTITMMPTLLEIAGLDVPPHCEARSLAESVSQGREPAPEPVFSEIKFGYQGYRDDHRRVMVRDWNFKLSLFLDPLDPERFRSNPEGSLYDLETDPGETRNLYTDPRHAATVQRLTNLITAWDRRPKELA
jgi:arylsulfatase